MMKKTLAIVAAVVVVALAALVISLTQAGSKGFNPEDVDPYLLQQEKDAFTIIVYENRTTGYQWEVAIDNEDIVALEGTKEYDSSKDKDIVGAGVYKAYRFKVNDSGTAAIEFTYLRPFDPEDVAEHFILHAEMNGNLEIRE